MFKSKDRKAQKVQAALEKKAEIVYAAATSAAKAAKKAGRKVFQYMDVVSTTKGEVIPMVGAFTKDEQGFTICLTSPRHRFQGFVVDNSPSCTVKGRLGTLCSGL